jgi:hypothetical protein
MDEVAARRVGEQLLDRLERVLAKLEAAYRAEIPEYAALSADAMQSTVLQISRGVAEAFLRSLVAGGAPTVDEVPGLDRIGTARVAMGVPLEPVLHAFRVFGRVVWIEMADVTEPGRSEVLADIGARWMDWIDRASSQAASAYLAASNDLIRRLDARRDALLDALLDASTPADAAAVATEFQIALAPAYLPVVIEGPDVAIRIDDVVDVAPRGSIVGARASGVWILAPEPPADPLRLLDAGHARTIIAGEPAAPGPALAAAVRDVQSILDAATRSGRTGVLDRGDLIAERLVLSDDPVTSGLDETVASLRAGDRSGAIESTLDHYLGCGSVPRTAAALHAHPNTVTYRLGRARTLTGLDPKVPAEAAVLHLALVRSRLQASDPSS